jgi:hypothetical protein
MICLLATAHGFTQSKADSGWVPLFNGKDLEGFYAHFFGTGVVALDKQNAFQADSGMIHVPKAKAGTFSAGQGHLFTLKLYSWYRVRVEYRFNPEDTAGSQNAGLIVHVDNDQALIANTKERRPRSIEINMRRAESSPWTLWSAGNLGPYITTTVRTGTQQYLAKADGGVEWTNDPWNGDKRIIFSSYPNPERPMGQWNQGEAVIYGDSLGLFYLNGTLRTQGWNFSLRGKPEDADPAKRIPCANGGIGLQSEAHEVWYRNFEIMELEPHTRKPLHAKPAAILQKGRPAAIAPWEDPRIRNGRTLDGRLSPIITWGD